MGQSIFSTAVVTLIVRARMAGMDESLEHAAADLKLAQDKLALGKRWIAAKDYQPALWLVEQAQVDAELAQMKAISAKIVRDYSKAGKDVEGLEALEAGGELDTALNNEPTCSSGGE